MNSRDRAATRCRGTSEKRSSARSSAKRTWGGLVGIGGIPPLMDGGQVTSPSFGFFNPQGQWDVEKPRRAAGLRSGHGAEAG